MIEKFSREAVKFVRDRHKSSYPAKTECYVCGSKTNLETHHVYSLSEMWHSWVKENKIEIKSDEDVMKWREVFIEQKSEQLRPETLYTLCKTHHQLLHKIYGKTYSIARVPKVIRWLDLRREQWVGSETQ